MKGGMGGFLFAITHAPVSPFLPNSKCYTEISLRICYGKKLLFLGGGIFCEPDIFKVSFSPFLQLAISDSEELRQKQNPKIFLF